MVGKQQAVVKEGRRSKGSTAVRKASQEGSTSETVETGEGMQDAGQPVRRGRPRKNSAVEEGREEEWKELKNELLRLSDEVRRITARMGRVEERMGNLETLRRAGQGPQQTQEVTRGRGRSTFAEGMVLGVHPGSAGGLGLKSYADVIREAQTKWAQARTASREKREEFMKDKAPITEEKRVEVRQQRESAAQRFAVGEVAISDDLKNNLLTKGVTLPTAPTAPNLQVDIQCLYIGLRARPYKVIRELITVDLGVPKTAIIGMSWVGRDTLELLVNSAVGDKLEGMLRQAGIVVSKELATEERFIEGKVNRLLKQLEYTTNPVAARWYDRQYRTIIEQMKRMPGYVPSRVEPVTEQSRVVAGNTGGQRERIGSVKRRREERRDVDMENPIVGGGQESSSSCMRGGGQRGSVGHEDTDLGDVSEDPTCEISEDKGSVMEVYLMEQGRGL